LLNGAIGFFQEYSAEKTSEALQALVPHTARVRRDGALADIPARGVVRGDVCSSSRPATISAVTGA
jgi:magnesium-transporting ATPase (P-type)